MDEDHGTLHRIPHACLANLNGCGALCGIVVCHFTVRRTSVARFRRVCFLWRLPYLRTHATYYRTTRPAPKVTKRIYLRQFQPRLTIIAMNDFINLILGLIAFACSFVLPKLSPRPNSRIILITRISALGVCIISLLRLLL